MKKFLLFFISVLSFSLLPIINNVYAQEREYPNYIMLVPYQTYLHVQDNVYTYEFEVYYYAYNVHIDSIAVNEYFLINDIDINFRKGTNRNTNSYVLDFLNVPQGATFTTIGLRITVVKSLAEDNYNYNPYNPYEEGTIDLLFTRDTALYILYQSDTGSIEYNSGFNAGYDLGYDIGYDDGYNDGYLDGRDDGYEAGQNDGYNYGYDLGYDVGYDDGYNIGRNDGYNNGYNNGYINGEQAGYARGHDEGYNNGYNIGYNTGYQLGYDDGLEYSYDYGYNDGYQDGYSKGINDKFTANIHVWLIPAIIIVFVVGIFVTYKRGSE